MKDNIIYVVTEFYTTIKHNNVTPEPVVSVFSSQDRAISYIRGTDGNGKPLKFKDRVGIALKDGAIPQYDLGCHPQGIRFNVKDECLADYEVKQGGHVYKVYLEERELR